MGSSQARRYVTHARCDRPLPGQPPRIWRYAHFYSYSLAQKRAVLSACLKKIHRMASDDPALVSSAVQKLAEFRRLCYPRPLLRSASAIMAVVTRATQPGFVCATL